MIEVIETVFAIFTIKILFIMRYPLFIILLSLISFQITNAQTTCCSNKETASLSFKAFAGDEKFIAGHIPPIPLDFQPKVGKMVSLKTEDGKEAAVFEVKSGKSEGKVILVFHEWWGLNDYIKREAEQLHFETGATVLALDLYDKQVTSDPDLAGKLMQSLKEDRARSIIKAALDYGGKFSKYQMIGWCMGGGWSLQAALMAGSRNYGAVVYYGMPEKDTAKLATLEAPVLGIYAKRDAWISPAVVSQFQADMKSAGKLLTVYNYDADHAFANPSNPKFDKVAAGDAHKKAVDFIKKNFEEKLRPAPSPEKGQEEMK
jgi:carboxymethylenebutenolidase